MKWIKYQIVQCTLGQDDVLLDKKVGYSDANLAIAQNEAYQGQYEIFEDDTPEPSKGIAPANLSNAIDSTSGVNDGIAATPAAVKEVYDFAKTKANESDVAKTAMLGASNSGNIYVKIHDFGNWGTGAWYAKGFSMLITSRGGETIWVSVAADDSNTRARALRLMNSYSKIASIYYCAEENALYVLAAGWCNNINAHIISNVYGDYQAKIEQASSLPATAVAIPITEFGPSYSEVNIGNSQNPLKFVGSADRPYYNNKELVLKEEFDALVASAVSVLSGNAEPTADQGEDGDVYLVTEG